MTTASTSTSVRPSSTTAAPSTTTTTTTAAAPGPGAVVVRAGGTIPAEAVAALEAVGAADGTAVLDGGQVLLTASVAADGTPVDTEAPGWAVPLDALAAVPDRLGPLVAPADAAVVEALRPGTVLLSRTSAALRRIGAGGRLTVGGRDLLVAGVVRDRAVGTAELVVHAEDARPLGLDPARYLLLGTSGDLPALVREVGTLLEAHPRVLAATLGRPPWPASWREVLPTALVKARFGEFAVRPAAGRSVVQEPGWAERNIGTTTVPVLGEVRCHRAVLAPLTDALGELEAAGLTTLLRPGDYGGCFSPRLIAPGAALSRHAWGLAVDVNVSTNPFGAPGRQDPRLIEIMERHGFTYGGRWPVPDGMHFEYRG